MSPVLHHPNEQRSLVGDPGFHPNEQRSLVGDPGLFTGLTVDEM
jgi:hypothetical protein